MIASDPSDIALRAHVAPPGWQPPRPADRYNLVVIGGGTAGLVCAMGAAGLGARVALVERHLLGGDCLNTGCVPSKALLASARQAKSQDEVPDFKDVMSRMRRIRAEIAPHDSARRLSDAGVDVFFGAAAFSGNNTVTVDGVELRFARAVIATGASPVVPRVPGLAERGFLTSETLFDLNERPAHLAVIGAGPIGCEMAQAFRRLGSRVTVVSRDDEVLPNEDPTAAALVRRSLEGDGVHLVLGAEVSHVSDDLLHVQQGEETRSLNADAVLVAVGRSANLHHLGLEAAGVRTDHGRLIVDDHLRTSNRRIFAAGDVASGYRFTHAADAMARIVIQNALFLGRKKVSDLLMAWCTYTDPELAHVGPQSAELEEKAGRWHEVDLASLDRARTDGLSSGLLRLAEGRDGRLLGGTIVAPGAGDLASVLITAVQGGLGVRDFASMVIPYPTLAEAFKRAGDQANRERLTPLISGAMRQFLAWRR
ncbi:MAG: mercuric reductase [Rhodothermales bacterium]|nr:mercuric reductase [Rhodothermales bacterium]MBO6778146.1 mercuric reductase [Rhodothermales bacterium]